jgi:deazaflavin-dependent oxidoreductase (nitroreductase family)
MTMSDRFVIWISTSPVVTWIIKHFASRVDPLIFKATNGRFTSMGPPSMPMVTLTTTGRRSGQPRAVHLATIEHAGDHLVVASAMGQSRHPAWRYNLEANARVEVQMRGERFVARAQVLTDSEKEEVWAEIRAVIPQMNVYEKRTDRNIRVFRLCRVGGEDLPDRSKEEKIG